MMKAARLQARGGPEQIRIDSVPVPAPAAGEILIRVAACGITPTELLWDETYKSADGGSRIPSIPGHDVSGTVESVGPGVNGFSAGRAVYGLIDFPFHGAAAEYVVAPADTIAPKPMQLDHLQAAAVPMSALTAWQALFDHAKLQAGQRVLVHGAAGAVGAMAIQLAHLRGIEVVATASSRHVASLREQGVSQVIDYTAQRFEQCVQPVDAVIDSIGGETRRRSWQTLKSGGILLGLNAPIKDKPSDDVRGLFFIVRPSRAQLIDIAKLIDAGKLRPKVQSIYSLDDARTAYEFGAKGHLHGKIVLKVR